MGFEKEQGQRTGRLVEGSSNTVALNLFIIWQQRFLKHLLGGTLVEIMQELHHNDFLRTELGVWSSKDVVWREKDEKNAFKNFTTQ